MKKIMLVAAMLTIGAIYSSTTFAVPLECSGWVEINVAQVFANDEGSVTITGIIGGELHTFSVPRIHFNKKEIYSLALMAATSGRPLNIGCITTATPYYYSVSHAYLRF